MKKILTAVLILTLCLSVLTVGAAAADDSYTIHMDVSESGWEALYVYYWGVDNAPAWPGVAVTEKDSDGWFTFQVPMGVTGLVLSNGAGSQTVDLVDTTGMLLDQECWVIVKSEQEGGKHKFGCSATKPAAGEDVKPVDPTAPEIAYMEILGAGLEGITWNPGGSVRMEEVSDGVYSVTFRDVPAGEGYTIKFAANGNWSDYNFGGSFTALGQATDAAWNSSDITFSLAEATDLTITLDLTGFSYSTKSGAKFTITAGTEQPQPDPVPDITVHVIVPSDWTEVYIYTFNPENNGYWPGTKAENGVLTITADFEGLIVNNNNGVQTADIKDIDLTKAEVWITVAADGAYTLSYKDPGKPPVTGDTMIFGALLAMMTAGGALVLLSKKKTF